jgi:predicted ATP-binding protein involved in virulence
MDAFPQTQFILTTHSEEIIAAVPSACVISLDTGPEGVAARSIPPVQGATFDRVLTDAMDIPSSRPPEVQAQLDEYWDYVDRGEGESVPALALRRKLDVLFRGTEPDLTRADLEIRRNRARRGIGP